MSCKYCTWRQKLDFILQNTVSKIAVTPFFSHSVFCNTLAAKSVGDGRAHDFL